MEPIKPIIEMSVVEMKEEIFRQIQSLKDDFSAEAHTNVEVWVNMIIATLENENWKRGYIDGLTECGKTTKLSSKIGV